MQSLKAKSSKESIPVTSYEKDVEDVLAELSLNNDSLDRPDFDVIAYINEMFPTEQSLTNIDESIAETEKRILELDTETRDIVRGRWNSEDEGQEVVQEAMQMIQSLFARIRDVQDRATRSEEMVHEITKDIQQLDQAKRNLTVSITTLNNLIIIVNALDRLNAVLHIDKETGSNEEVSKGSKLTTTNASRDAFNPFVDNGPDIKKISPQGNADTEEHLTLSLMTEVSDLLAQAQRLMQPMMAAYGSVPSVSGLSRELDTIHNVLANRLIKELKTLLTRSRNITDQAPVIQAACQLMELLPQSLQVKSQLLDWFILRQLGEYKELFEPSQTAAWLDKIDHRYAWLRTNLPPLERKLQVLFPAEWHVSERLVMEFCRITKTDLEVVMKRRQAEMTHNLLIFGLQRTLAFEASLNKIYENFNLSEHGPKEIVESKTLPVSKLAQSLNPFDDDGDEATETSPARTNGVRLSEGGHKLLTTKPESSEGGEETKQWHKQPFDGIISSCFDAQFDLYLNHVEKALREQLHTRFIGDFTVNKSSVADREFGDVFKDDSSSTITTGSADPGENTLSSATELFLLYRQVVKQTLQLNRGRGLLGLVHLLRQYLSEYNVLILLSQIPGLSVGAPNAPSGSGGTSFFAPEVAAKMAAFGLSGLSALGISRTQAMSGGSDMGRSQSLSNLPSSEQSGMNASQFFANLMKDDSQLARLSREDIQKVCIVLVTAAYCLKTVEELEKRLKIEVRPPSLAGEISFSAEIDGFAACRSACVHRLVSDLENAVEPHLVSMARVPWNNLVQVGDQSIFVTEIVKHLRTQVPLIRDTLYSVRATFTQICIKFAGSLITRFIASLYRCKPVNTFGAEQLLLDTQSLKSALIHMPVFGAKFSQTPPRSFTNLIHEGMGRAERIIKAVMLPVGSTSASAQPNAIEPGFASSTSFIMGPVDSQAAEVFLASYKQLLPDASPTDLQKVLEMKGMKYGEIQLIVDIFRGQLDPKSNDQANLVEKQANSKKDDAESRNDTTDRIIADGDSPRSQSILASDNQIPGIRLKPLEKLVKKR
ncbi:Vacuolar protein sorting-associated protein 53 [Fasciola hepatica]|uniref:Vacuolar protein sorting-associated protein 53 homolog n=1 Tax=Fasciola hepatica TaxID=6192 RepID=A0A4E0R395_FASHE|nr:Vacuolar protein sorting-associated protein 53 [Fasciola hepatica]